MKHVTPACTHPGWQLQAFPLLHTEPYNTPGLARCWATSYRTSHNI